MNVFKSLGLIACAILAGFYSYWIALHFKGNPLGSVVAATLSVILIGIVIIRLMPALARQWGFSGENGRELSQSYADPKSERMILLKILIIMVVSRVVIYAAAYFINLVFGGDTANLAGWLRSDGPHYVGLAKNGYLTEGDPRFHIVFFPFYPGMIRLIAAVLGDYFASGLFVSNVSAVCAAVVAYKLARMDMDKSGAIRSVKYLFILPAAFFFNAPMSESLFLLLSLLVFYCIRNERWLLGGLLGTLAAFTRSLGIVLAVPMFVEFISQFIELKGWQKGLRLKSIGKFLCIFLVPLGTGLYILLNWKLTGNPFQFMIYQKEHWSQQISYFFNTVLYMTGYAANWIKDDPMLFWAISVPSLITIFGTLLLMIAGAKKQRASYTAYSLFYFIFAIGPTWLLSAPRYLACLFPLAFVLGDLTKRRFVDVIATVLCAAGFLMYMRMFLTGMSVY